MVEFRITNLVCTDFIFGFRAFHINLFISWVIRNNQHNQGYCRFQSTNLSKRTNKQERKNTMHKIVQIIFFYMRGEGRQKRSSTHKLVNSVQSFSFKSAIVSRRLFVIQASTLQQHPESNPEIGKPSDGDLHPDSEQRRYEWNRMTLQNWEISLMLLITSSAELPVSTDNKIHRNVIMIRVN